VTVKTTLSVRFLAPLLLIAPITAVAQSAASRLNVGQSAITVSVPVGTNAPAYTVDTFNIGTGSLNLQASSSVPWLVPTVGASTECGLRGGCYPVSIAFQTASLTAGTYTGTITLSDANALDSPQSITVTAQVGGDVPSNLTFYVAPGGSASASFTTNGPVTSKIANAPWLTTSTSLSTATGAYVTTITASA
jgi:hypothetical protein